MTLEKILASPEILLCAGEATCPVTLGGRELELRLLSAYEAAVCLREAARRSSWTTAPRWLMAPALPPGACGTASAGCLKPGRRRCCA